MRQVFPLFPFTPGGDFSGVVDSVGEAVRGFQVGDEVIGYSMEGGAYVIAIDAQKAHQRGAKVIGTASARSLERVKGYEADRVLDYAAIPFEKNVKDNDEVLDTVGGAVQKRSYSVLKAERRAGCDQPTSVRGGRQEPPRQGRHAAHRELDRQPAEGGGDGRRWRDQAICRQSRAAIVPMSFASNTYAAAMALTAVYVKV